MASKLPFMHWMSEVGKPRKRQRLQGLLPPLFWVCFEKVAGDHVSSMLLSDMDYPMMQNVSNLIRQRRMPQNVWWISTVTLIFVNSFGLWKIEDGK